MNADNAFDEIYDCHTAPVPYIERYKRLYGLLDRLTKELTKDYAASYTSLFSRLYALCRMRKYPSRTIELFRVNAKKVMRGEYQPTEDDYLYDLKALCEAVGFFLQRDIPLKLKAVIPVKWRNFTNEPVYKPIYKKLRVVVARWDDDFIYALREGDGAGEELRVVYAEHFASLKEMLYEGAQLNLLSVTVKGGFFIPALIVLEPDFIVDVSALSACKKNYGSHPLNYLLNKLKPSVLSPYILLGNTADRFLYDCVTESVSHPATFQESIVHSFEDAQMDYSACEGIDAAYFEKARKLFDQIHSTVNQNFGNAAVDIDKDTAQLEASFICEALGMQGRMDLVTTDFTRIIEQKSGKAEGWGDAPLRPKPEHLLQMELYKQIIYYNMDLEPDKEVNGYLFYALYPELFDERTSLGLIREAVILRNGIVANEQAFRKGELDNLTEGLTSDTLNVNATGGKLWTNYQRPQLEAVIRVLTGRSGLEKKYFDAFFAFVEREEFYAKIGDNTPDSGRGFAETWRATTLQKQANGNILVDLHLSDYGLDEDASEEEEGVEWVRFLLPEMDEDFLPNFRRGDAVLCYERNDEKDTVLNKQIVRGTLTEITPEAVTVRLHERQRSAQIFPMDSHYALEHDYMGASFTALYRGLFRFLSAPKERRDLWLGRRTPQVDASVELNGKYLNSDIDRIVLRAKQAKDYFLLVGPPGTGKTSVALKSMVEEFYNYGVNEEGKPYRILLLAYTNRAVDEICQMLSTIEPVPEYIRLGQEMNCEEPWRSHLLRHRMKGCTRRADITNLLLNCRIYVSTVASVAGKDALFRLMDFDVALIDEASQLLEPHLIGLLSRVSERTGKPAVRKFVLIGDHKQLPAVVLQEEKESEVADDELKEIGLTNCRNSLFERLFAQVRRKKYTGVSAMLCRQGRMHPAVAAFANTCFYNGKLDVVPLVHQKAKLPYTSFSSAKDSLERYVATTRVGFIPAEYPPASDNNKVNRKEAAIVAGLVGTIYTLYRKNKLPLNPEMAIGIIVPFRNQIAMIRHELKKLRLPDTERITIDTVERYQGSQRDIIIFSTTISRPYQLGILSSPVEVDGQQIDRKLNVALTRAKKQLFITGNPDLLSQESIYRELIEYTRVVCND